MGWIRSAGGSVRIDIWLQPRSGRAKLVGLHSDRLKVSVTSPPVDGRANKDLIKFIANKLGVPGSAIKITAGKTGRRKTIEVSGLVEEQVRAKLQL